MTTDRRRWAWVDWLAAFAAIGSLAAVDMLGLPSLRTSTFSGTDFKTLYASVWCLVHGQSAYSFAGLQHVFQANGVATPVTWFGHAPVYPPVTLALLAPMVALGMVAATWCAIGGSAVLLAVAVAELLRYAAEEFGLAVGWRIVLAGLCAAPPILSFALTVGNVSVAVAALSIMAFVRRKRSSAWVSGLLLAVAFLLKPHLAVWVAIPLLLLREREGRAICARAAGIVAIFTAVVAAVLAATGGLAMQLRGFLQILHTESMGSMNPSSHEALPAVAQIPSLRSLVGFWTGNRLVQIGLTTVMLAGLLVVLVRYTRRQGDEPSASLAVAAWCAFGLLATYHRAHDALILLVVGPWILARISQRPRRWMAWAALGCYILMTCGPDGAGVAALVAPMPVMSAGAFLVLRQTALADLGLLLVLLVALGRERPKAAPADDSHERARDGREREQ